MKPIIVDTKWILKALKEVAYGKKNSSLNYIKQQPRDTTSKN